MLRAASMMQMGGTDITLLFIPYAVARFNKTIQSSVEHILPSVPAAGLDGDQNNHAIVDLLGKLLQR